MHSCSRVNAMHIHTFHTHLHTPVLLDPVPQADVKGSAAADAASSRGGSSSGGGDSGGGDSGGSSGGAGRRREGLALQMRQAAQLMRGVSCDVVLRLIQDSIAAVSTGAASPDLLNVMLLLAAKEGSAEAARQLLATGRCHVGHAGFDGFNALHMAAAEGHTAMLRLLLSAGWAVDARSFEDDTPITLATHRGHAQAVRALIDAGADVNACNCTPMTALCLAAGIGHCEILTMLLNAGADINSNLYLSGTALHFATKVEDLTAVQLLLDRGADPNLPDACGLTPLCWAIHVELPQPIINALKQAGGRAPSPLGMMQQVVAEAMTGINFQVRGCRLVVVICSFCKGMTNTWACDEQLLQMLWVHSCLL